MASKETKLQIVVDAQDRTKGTFNALKSNLDDIKRNHEGLIDTMKGIGAASAAAFAGLAFLTKGIVGAGVEFEQTQIAFETMLGSAELAQKTLTDLAQFAAKTPFELPQLERTAKQLLAYGTSAEDLIPTLQMLGDITAGVGMDKLPQLTLAFGQVKAATKLTGTELRQFTEAGVPMLDALVQYFNKTGKAATSVTNAAGLTEKQITSLGNANEKAQAKLHSLNITLQKQQNRMKQMRKDDKDSGAAWKNLKIDIAETERKIAETTATISEQSGTLQLSTQMVTAFGEESQITAAKVQEMISAGEVSFEDVQAALQSMTAEGGKFHELMAKQAQSLGGLWSTFRDNVSLTARAIGMELLPYLKPLVVHLIEITQAVGTFVKEHPRLSAAILVISLGFTGLMALLFPLALMLPGLILMFSGLATVFGLVTAMSAPVLLAVGGIITVLTLLASQGYLSKQAWVDVWMGIRAIAVDGANAVINAVESMVNFVLSGVNKAIDAINKVIKLAQKVPGIGDKLSTIKSVSAVDFGTLNMDTVGAHQLPGLSSMPGSTPSVVVTGNTFLDQDTAEKVGDLIFGRLKLSNPI